MGHTVEADTESLRHHLRSKNQLNANRGSIAKRTLPVVVALLDFTLFAASRFPFKALWFCGGILLRWDGNGSNA